MRVSFLVVSLTICFLVACGENIESHYATFAELQHADSGARSWMPTWIPESATDIRDWHNLDTNSTLIAFTVPKAPSALLVGCRPTTIVRNPGEGSRWWPDDRTFATLQHFECEERTTFGDGHVEVRKTGAAIDRRTNRVYFWRSGG